MRIGGLFVALEACLGWNDNIHNDSQLVKVGFIHIQEAHSGQDWRSQFWMIFNHRPGKPRQWKGEFEPRIPEPCLSFRTLWDADLRCARTSMICQQMLRLCHEYPDTGTQYRLDCLYAKWDWRICSAGSVTKICPGFSGAPEFQP
jgi:hypothetical protein